MLCGQETKFPYVMRINLIIVGHGEHSVPGEAELMKIN